MILRKKVRVQEQRDEEPTLAIIVSQTTKATRTRVSFALPTNKRMLRLRFVPNQSKLERRTAADGARCRL